MPLQYKSRHSPPKSLLIEREQFQDLGCGVADMSLLASALLTPDALLWTVDKNLEALAARLDVAFRASIS
jgi:hypothetical protein